MKQGMYTVKFHLSQDLYQQEFITLLAEALTNETYVDSFEVTQ